jgi:hypothetical protein
MSDGTPQTKQIKELANHKPICDNSHYHFLLGMAHLPVLRGELGARTWRALGEHGQIEQ